jgi:hypothetical protein
MKTHDEILKVELPEQVNDEGISFVKFIYPQDVIDFFALASDEAINIVLKQCFNASIQYELNESGEMDKFLCFQP